MRKLIIILIVVVFMANIHPIENINRSLDKYEDSSNSIGINSSNYTLELKTDAIELNRAKYLNYLKTDHGITTVNYDDYLDTWYYRDITNGTWYETPIFSETNDNYNWMNIRVALTDFGVFKLNINQRLTQHSCTDTNKSSILLRYIIYLIRAYIRVLCSVLLVIITNHR